MLFSNKKKPYWVLEKNGKEIINFLLFFLYSTLLIYRDLAFEMKEV